MSLPYFPSGPLQFLSFRKTKKLVLRKKKRLFKKKEGETSGCSSEATTSKCNSVSS